LASHPHVLICRACQSQNQETAETCFKCGQSLFVVTEGALLAGRYEILEPLGKGGMGMVYKARDRELDEIVALKVLRPEVARSGDMARRFRSEIKIARKIRHRNVCGIHEFGQDGHLQFIAMELIEGVDFKRVLKERGALPIAEAYDVSIQTAKGLQAIHDAGIVHRDLKTPNLMRDSQGVVRLMDFGIAKDVGATGAEQTVTGQIVGTPEYMSPEQARGQRVDHRSDIYALGVVVWELFTGDVPFRGDSPIATLYRQIQEPLPLDGPQATKLPGPLKPVLEKALAKEPQDRYQSVRELAEALRAARTASGISGTSGKIPIVRLGGTDATTIVPAGADAAALRPDIDDDDFGPAPLTAEQPAPTVAIPSTSRPLPIRPRTGGAPSAATPAPTVVLDRSRAARAEPPPSTTRRALTVAGVVAAIAISVVVWERVRPRDEGVPVITVSAPPATVTAPVLAPTAPSGIGVETARQPPIAAKPVSPSPRSPAGRVADAGAAAPPITLPPPRTATAPPPTLPPISVETPAPATPAPATAPPVTLAPPSLAPATSPPTVPPTSGSPPVWNSAPAVRQALNAYVAAFVSLDPNAIKAVYPGISKSELERIRYYKAYDMEVEPARIEISGRQARVELSLKAAIKAFTGKEHVLAPHQEVFTLEYRSGAWVRVK
jgi:serine/threonine protein kinase